MKIHEVRPADPADIDNPAVDITLTVYEALNIECALRCYEAVLRKSLAAEAFTSANDEMLAAFVEINNSISPRERVAQ